MSFDCNVHFKYEGHEYSVNLTQTKSDEVTDITLNGRSYSIHTASQDYEVVKALFQQIQLSAPSTIREIQECFSRIDQVESLEVTQASRATQVALSILSPSAPVSSSNVEMAAEIDDYLQGLVTTEDFRGSVLVVRGGEPLLHKGYGVANKRGEEITEQTIFHIGSLTKSFTAAAIVLLEQEGKLNIHAPIKEYLPADLYSSNWDQITVHQLLNHTSGIPNFDKEYYALTEPLKEKDLVGRFKDKPLESEPGSTINYSNCGYDLLGIIIAKVSGQSYGDFMTQQVFQKLDMQNSGFGGDYDEAKAATGYIRDLDGDLVPDEKPKEYFGVSYAAGGLYSTTEDLQKWNAAFYDDSILTQEVQERVLHSSDEASYFPEDEKYPSSYYGYGVVVYSHPDQGLVVGHDGRIDGFVSEINRYPKSQDCIVILSNNQNIDTMKMNEHIDGILYKIP